MLKKNGWPWQNIILNQDVPGDILLAVTFRHVWLHIYLLLIAWNYNRLNKGDSFYGEQQLV